MIFFPLPAVPQSLFGKIGEKTKEKIAKWLALMLLALVRIFHELLSREREDGQATGLTIVDCGMRNGYCKFAE